MAKRKAKIDLGMPIPKKLERGQLIVQKMTGNVSFPNPNPALAEVDQALDFLSKAYQLALNGGKPAKEEQRTANTKVNTLLRPLCDYVNEVANGNTDMIYSSGFELSKDPAPIGEMPQVENVRCKGSNGDGAISVRWKRVYGARNYVVELSTDGISYEARTFPTKSNTVLEGLIIATYYWIRVAANGAKGLGTFSVPQKVLAT
jgi:hypothetical protein